MSAHGISPGWLVEQLPRALADDRFARQLVSMFENMASQLRWKVSGFEDYLDVGLAPPAFVRWMGGWLGVQVDGSLEEAHQRRLARAAGPLALWRGTRRGLQGLLEAFTRSPVEVSDEGGVFPQGSAPENRGHITIRAGGSGGLADQQLVEIIRAELPANASFDLHIEGRAVMENDSENAGAGRDVPDNGPAGGPAGTGG